MKTATIIVPVGSDVFMHLSAGEGMHSKCGKIFARTKKGAPSRKRVRAFTCIGTTTPGKFPVVLVAYAHAPACTRCFPQGRILVEPT